VVHLANPATPLEHEGRVYHKWGRVVRETPDEVDLWAFFAEEDGRLFVCEPQPAVRVYGQDQARIVPHEEHPFTTYAAAVRGLAFDDSAGNMTLARRCVEWGLHFEARALLARVLVFQPDHSEALAWWGLRLLEDGHYAPLE
jgi:hypothetical protein